MLREPPFPNAMRRVLLGLIVMATATCGFFTHPSRPSSGGAGSGGTGGNNADGSTVGQTDGSIDEIVDGGAPPDIIKTSCVDTPYGDPWSPGYQEGSAVAGQVSAMVGSMNITDKANQMRGTDTGGGTPNYSDIFRTPDAPGKVKGFKFRDGPKGVCMAAQLPAGKQGYSTAFPVPAARGAAFDMDLEYAIGLAVGDETVASGNTMILAPVINILRHPAWGRAQETYGEDSYLLGRMGTAFTAGAQKFVPACAKHYAANNIESNRGSDNAVMDEQTLQEEYARHFGMVIQDSGVACIMASYNLVNGTKATQSKHLLTDILRGEFNFQGLVLSDWWAMPPGNGGQTDAAAAQNAVGAIQAGMDLELPWNYNYKQIETVVSSGQLSDQAVTQAATRILRQKYRFNIASLDNSKPLGLSTPTTTLNATTGSIDGNTAHIALAHKAAVESMVLLKNDKSTLPISRTTVKKIAVLGANVPFHLINADTLNGSINFATDVRTGDLGSSRVYPDPAKSSGPFAGIQAVAGNGITVVSGNAASAASGADFIVVVAGLTPQDEGEEYTGAADRDSFALDAKIGGGAQNKLITDAAALGKPMVVVLEGGSVIDMPWLAQVPAVVMAWYPAQDGGKALGELLFGDANFSGKLPVTWPKAWADEPTFNAGTSTNMDFYVGYKYFDHYNKAPLYPFGYGLSYTSFKYEFLGVPCSDVTKGGVVNVTAQITNTGTVAGDEVAFLFVSYPGSKVRRPVKELKGFHRVTLAPGVAKRITFPLRISDLKYWDTTSNSWQVESGTVQIMVGGSSTSLPLMDTMVIK